MKKYILIIVIFFTIQVNVNAKEFLGDVTRTDGKKVSLPNNEYIGFDKVSQRQFTNGTDTYINVDCKDPGVSPCRAYWSDGGHINLAKKYFNSDIINSEYNKMLSFIDEQIINGKLQGTITSKIQIYSTDDNKPYVVCLETVWNCDSLGNGVISLYADLL